MKGRQLCKNWGEDTQLEYIVSAETSWLVCLSNRKQWSVCSGMGEGENGMR